MCWAGLRLWNHPRLEMWQCRCPFVGETHPKMLTRRLLTGGRGSSSSFLFLFISKVFKSLNGPWSSSFLAKISRFLATVAQLWPINLATGLLRWGHTFLDHIGHRDWRCDPTGVSFTCEMGNPGVSLGELAQDLMWQLMVIMVMMLLTVMVIKMILV